MKKILLSIPIILICLSLYATSYNIPGPYGGTLTINCGEIQKYSQTDFGAECLFEYKDFSVIPGYVYNGSLSGGFSYLGSEGDLYIDFFQGSYFDIEVNQNIIKVTFPVTISFDLGLTDYKCKKVEAWNNNKPQILVNDSPLDVTPEIFKYLIPLENLRN